jgi:Fic family protein
MRILKRKKGKQNYYYLQNSYRDGKKVITKEIYLGKNIPKNIDELKKSLEKDPKDFLNSKLESIKKNFSEYWKKLPESVKEKEKEEISIAFTYNTNAIEGSTITIDETREIIQDNIAPNKSLRDVKETEAHSKVFLRMLEQRNVITRDIILKWHNNLFCQTKPDIAGKFRDYLVKVGAYLAPDWQDVEKLIGNYLEFVNKEDGLNPVKLAATAHYRFEKIHPFGDGNGRIGRLIMNYILWHHGYPMLIIEKKKRKQYYSSLAKNEDDFVKYFIRRYLTAHNKRVFAA